MAATEQEALVQEAEEAMNEAVAVAKAEAEAEKAAALGVAKEETAAAVAAASMRHRLLPRYGTTCCLDAAPPPVAAGISHSWALRPHLLCLRLWGNWRGAEHTIRAIL